MPATKSLDLWQEGEPDHNTGLPFRRSTIIPDEYAAFTKKKSHPLDQLTTFFRGLKSKCRSRQGKNDTKNSQQTSQQHSSFRQSMIISARLEKEHTGFKAPNKLANVLCGSTVANQAVWRKEPSPMTEGHPILRTHPDVQISSEYDEAVHWALDKMFRPNDSQISLA